MVYIDQDVALEALDGESNMKKYIDLDKAIASLRDYFCDPAESRWGEFAEPAIVDICEKILRELPGEDVRANITGEWICVENLKSVALYRCSECGQMELSPKYKFCVNCGASMRGE